MDYKNIEGRMNKTISVYEEKLSEVRAGRANPAILNKVKIDYYGTPTPINPTMGCKCFKRYRKSNTCIRHRNKSK